MALISAELTLENVRSVYSGRDGECCCGCSGKHTPAGSAETYAEVRRIFNKVAKAQKIEAYTGSHYSTVVGKRLYVVYPR